MQITINQAQIEESIRQYVGAQFREGKQFAVTLRATRGPEGYTADIEMLGEDGQPLSGRTPNPGTPLRIAETIEEARSAECEEQDAETPAEEATSEPDAEPDMSAEADSEEADAVEAEQAEEAEGADDQDQAPAAPTKSLFGGQKRPVNA